MVRLGVWTNQFCGFQICLEPVDSILGQVDLLLRLMSLLTKRVPCLESVLSTGLELASDLLLFCEQI
jgi:hypothetical protein